MTTTTVTVSTPVIQTVKLQSQVNVTAGGSDPTKLPLAGGTMTGNLFLDVAPTVDLQAATKKYVDDSAGADPTKLPLAGGTMTGEIVLDEIKETVYTMTTVDVDPANGSVQVRTLAGNETLTFTNIAAGQSVLVKIIPGANTLTLTNVAKWDNGGTAPSSIEAEHWIIVSNIDGTIVGTDRGGVA